MVMEKSTQPQGLASLKKSSMTPQKSSKTLAFDYDAAEDRADELTKTKPYRDAVKQALAEIKAEYD